MSERPIPGVSEEIADHIAGVLLALADVAEGNLDVRLALQLPEDHPLGALSLGIHEMTSSLLAAREESTRAQRELEEKLALIERQKIAMRELSTPIIEVWDRVLCLPIVGVVDTVRSAQMTDALLTAIAEQEAACAIVDITGIDTLDTSTADHFLRMARAVVLLGARCVLTGISPRIAQTMVQMGVALAPIACRRTLRDALREELELHQPRQGKGARDGQRESAAVHQAVGQPAGPAAR